MGIYGSGAFEIKKKLSFGMSYFWPWTFNEGGGVDLTDGDELSLRLVLYPNAIPVIKLHGSLSYTRVNFMPTILQQGAGSGLNLFDYNTVLKGELIYPLAPNLDIAGIIQTAAKRNTDGTLALEDGKPVIYPSVSIETRLHF